MQPTLIKDYPNIWNDNIAFVQHWDFSRANLNEQSRIDHITKVASICYDNPNVVGKESLYNRLKAEAIGLPSSSFEFVPILLTAIQCNTINEIAIDNKIKHVTLPVYKYGELIQYKNTSYVLTNFRALLNTYEFLKAELKKDQETLDLDITQWYNTEEECEIIKKHHNTFLCKMDIATSKQFNRHRVSLQELSRRYVSGKRSPLEFYVSKNMQNVTSIPLYSGEQNTTQYLIDECINHYNQALADGIQPQEARRILPQAMYTTTWSAWLPSQLTNFISLRADHHAQWEIRQIAECFKSAIKGI